MSTSVDIIIPVYNEEISLPICLQKLIPFCEKNLANYTWRVVIADNGSIDQTWKVTQQLSGGLYANRVVGVHLDQKGRGRALRKTWLGSEADIVCYMDVDLSTELSALPLLLNSIAKDGFDVATGSRLQRQSRTQRSFKREFISRAYNLLIKVMFQTRFSDAQCGFKAASREAVQDLVPVIEDNNWFFDSELLILAEKKGYRIADIPVEWEEDLDTRVKVVSTALEDIKGLLRLRFKKITKR